MKYCIMIAPGGKYCVMRSRSFCEFLRILFKRSPTLDNYGKYLSVFGRYWFSLPDFINEYCLFDSQQAAIDTFAKYASEQILNKSDAIANIK